MLSGWGRLFTWLIVLGVAGRAVWADLATTDSFRERFFVNSGHVPGGSGSMPDLDVNGYASLNMTVSDDWLRHDPARHVILLPSVDFSPFRHGYGCSESGTIICERYKTLPPDPGSFSLFLYAVGMLGGYRVGRLAIEGDLKSLSGLAPKGNDRFELRLILLLALFYETDSFHMLHSRVPALPQVPRGQWRKRYGLARKVPRAPPRS